MTGIDLQKPGMRSRLWHALNDPRVALPILVLLALATRLLGIAARPIWYDEAFSILFAEKGPSAMVTGTLSTAGAAASDVHPLAYYVLLWAWMGIFGESLIAVRLLSIIFGLCGIAAVYLLARSAFDGAVALAAGLLSALAPFQVHYSQEIRMYSLMSLCLLLATFAYWHATHRRGWQWWIAFSVFAALAQYTQSLSAFYLLALAVWPLLRRDWGTVRAIAFAGLLAVMLYLPWLVHLPSQFARVSQAYWIQRPALYRLFTLILVFVTNLPLPGRWLGFGLFVALFVVALALRRTINAVKYRSPNHRAGLWVLYLAFFPATILFLFSQWEPVYLERALLASAALFCIWLAWAGLEPSSPILLRVAMVSLLLMGVALGLYQHLTYTGSPYGPFRALTQNLESRMQAGDVILHSNKLSMLPCVYYDRLLSEMYIADTPGGATDTLSRPTQLVLGLPAQPSMEVAVGDARRVWYIIFDASLQEYLRAGYPTYPDLAWLQHRYPQEQMETWGSLRLYLFSRSP